MRVVSPSLVLVALLCATLARPALALAEDAAPPPRTGKLEHDPPVTLPENEVPVREARPLELALDLAWAGVPPDTILSLPIPSLRVSYTWWSTLAFEARYSSIIVINAVQVGVRVWLLESRLTPSIFVTGGAAFAPDLSGSLGLFTTGASLDYVFDHGVALSFEAALLGLVDEADTSLGYVLSPGLGYRF